MNYKAIIFDMDGTIIATEHIWKHATTSMIRQLGGILTPEITHEIAQRSAGLSTHETCIIIKELTGITHSIEEMVIEKTAIANNTYEDGIHFIDGFIEFHTKLASRNLKSGVATNASHATVEITNKKLNLKQFFGDHIYNITHVNYKGKPNPDLYLHAAQQIAVNPTECIAIEDSAPGIQAAKNAGMFCIGINTSRNRAVLGKADLIIDSYHELNLDILMQQ